MTKDELIQALRVDAFDDYVANAVSNRIVLAVEMIESQAETIRTLRDALQTVEDATYVDDFGDWTLPSNFDFEVIFEALAYAKELEND